jgi:hypothetical protein
VFQNIFEWIRAAEAAGMARLPQGSWSYFLQVGLGAISRSNPGSTQAQNALKGAYHALEFLAQDLKFSNIRGIEVLEALGSRRRIDFLVQEGANLVKYELKNVTSFSSDMAGQVIHRVQALKNEIRAAGGDPNAAETVRRALSDTVRYVFRGTEKQSAVVVSKLLDELKDAVGHDLAHVVDEVKDTIVKYTNRPLPI